MRTESGKAYILALKPGQWVSRGDIYEHFGTQSEFRRQVTEFRPDYLPRLGARCGRRGIEVREDARIVDVGDHCRESMGRIVYQMTRGSSQATIKPDAIPFAI